MLLLQAISRKISFERHDKNVRISSEKSSTRLSVRDKLYFMRDSRSQQTKYHITIVLFIIFVLCI